jgi:chaperonin GroES
MLGMLIDAGKEIASVKDVLTGEQPSANTPAATTIAMIEQGLKVFTAIYKRIHRALKDEFAKVYRLNQHYLEDPEMAKAFASDGPPIQPGDYKGKPSDIIPMSDPTMVSDMQRMARAQFLQQFLGKGLNDMAILQRVFGAAGIENIPELMPRPSRGRAPANWRICRTVIQGREHGRRHREQEGPGHQGAGRCSVRRTGDAA